MIVKLYSVLDTKVGYFANPWCDMSDASAIRNFGDAVRDGSNPNNHWHKHPEDFSLYFVGEFDTDFAELKPSLPKALITASAIQSITPTTEIIQ